MGIEFRVLGPLEVLKDGRAVQLGSRMQRELLAVLVLRANEVTSTDRLIEDLWPEQAPPTALKTLRVYVSRLRHALDDDDSPQLQTVGSGYRLQVAPRALDRERFEQLVADARRTEDALEASGLLAEALGLWRGHVLSDLGYPPFAQAEITRLEELRLVALEERIETDIELGRHTEVVGELRSLVSEHPFRERLWAALMLALYRGGRQAEALDVYREARRSLVEELGLEPGPALQQIEAAILRQDASLQSTPASGVETRSPRVRTGVAVALSVLVAAIAVVALTRDEEPAPAPAPAPGTGATSVDAPPPGSLARIDAAAGVVNLTVPDVLGLDPQRGVDPALDTGEGGLWLYAWPRRGGFSLTSFDEATGAVHGRVTVGRDFLQGAGLAVGSRTVWFLGGTPHRGDAVSRINPATFERLDPVFVRAGNATDIVLGGDVLWVGSDARTLTGFDALTGERISEIVLDATPDKLAFGAGAVWALDQLANQALRIDPDDGRILDRMAVEGNLEGIAAGEGGVWVLDDFAGTVTQIDPETGSTGDPIRVGPNPSALAVGLGSAWITDAEDGMIYRIDPQLGAQEPIRIGAPLAAIAIDEATYSLWVGVLDTPD